MLACQRFCQVMVVGENPAMILNTDWWMFWDDELGFDLDGGYERVFAAKREAERKKLWTRPAKPRYNFPPGLALARLC